jgi:hypothetical protein
MKESNKRNSVFFDGKSLTAMRLAKILVDCNQYDCFDMEEFLKDLNSELNKLTKDER